MKGISYVDDKLAITRAQVRNHPVGKLPLSREALQKFAIAQYRDNSVWSSWFVRMRDMVTDPILKAALQHSLEGEEGNVANISHGTLCLRFIQSLGLRPSNTVGLSGSHIGGYAESIINMIPSMSESEVCGFVMGTEDFVPPLFELFLPHYEKLGGVDTQYLTEHIEVDAGDHAVQMRRGCISILEQDEKALSEVLNGVELAGHFTLSVPDEIRAAYAPIRNRSTLQLAAAI